MGKFNKSLISISLLLVIFIVAGSLSTVAANDSSINTNNGTFTNVEDGSDLLKTNGLETNLESGVSNLASNSSNIIYISPNGTGTGLSINDTTNWDNAYNNSQDNGTIIFSDGTYNLINQNITKNLTLTSNNDNVTLTANANGYIFEIGDSNVVLNGLTFTNGTGATYEFASGLTNYGGAISAWFSNLTINNCNFNHNTVQTYGGAIFSQSSNININNTIFRNNYAYNSGGAIYLSNTSSVINNYLTLYTNNIATTGSGGAIYVVNGSVTNYRTHYINNTAKKSGAIRVVTGETSNFRCSFINNTAGRCGGALDALNIIAHYCTFINNTAPNGTAICYNDNLSVNNNWWGNNKPFAEKNLISKYINDTTRENITVDNYLVLSFTANPTNITTSESANLELKFQINNNGTISDIPENRTLAFSFYEISATNGNITPNSGIMFNNLTTKYTSDVSGNKIISATVANQVLSQNITVNTIKDKQTIIIIQNQYFYYGTKDSLLGNLTDINGNPIFNKTISLNLTRDSDGAWKVYNVSTNTTGDFSLPINLAVGNYKVQAIFNGDEDYNKSSTINTFYVADAVLLTSDLNITGSTVGNSFNGTLTTINGTPIINKNISIKIIRLSDGANKIYYVTTNNTGEFSLPINLDNGNYFIESRLVENNKLIRNNGNLICINQLANETRKVTTTYYTAKIVNSLNCYIFANPNNGLVDVNVTIELTRNSDMVSKNYTATTDSEGFYTLPINLNHGDYSFRLIFEGNSIYQPCMYQSTFKI